MGQEGPLPPECILKDIGLLDSRARSAPRWAQSTALCCHQVLGSLADRRSPTA